MKIDLTLQELKIIGEVLDEHIECIEDYYDVESYRTRGNEEKKLSEKIWNFYQEEKK